MIRYSGRLLSKRNSDPYSVIGIQILVAVYIILLLQEMIKFNKRKFGNLFKRLYLFKPVNLTLARDEYLFMRIYEYFLNVFTCLNQY